MKKSINFLLILALFFNPLYASKGSVFNLKKTARAEQTQKIALAEQTVFVVSSNAAFKEMSVREQGNIAQGQECMQSVRQDLNFIQNAGAVNLNQPAECFKLALGKTVAAINLQVKPLDYNLPKITMAELPKSIVAGENFMPTVPVSPAFPVIPFASYFILLAFTAGLKKIKKFSKQFVRFEKINFIKIAQLQILRC